MTKSELRSTYLEMRRAFNSRERAEKSNTIAERFFAEIDVTHVLKLHCFISMRHTGEIDTGPIFERLWAEHPAIETFAPRIDETTRELEAVRYSPTTTLKTNKWQIDEPIDGQFVQPVTLDLVVVPLLCFDRRGHRVGYGGGFYDRFLQKCRPDCIKAGLSFFPPVDQIDDVHAGDIPLDVCFTPGETYSFDRTT